MGGLPIKPVTGSPAASRRPNGMPAPALSVSESERARILQLVKALCRLAYQPSNGAKPAMSPLRSRRTTQSSRANMGRNSVSSRDKF